MRKTSILVLLVASIMLIGALQMQPGALTTEGALVAQNSTVNSHVFAGFDSENITIVLLTPANLSTVVGTFNMTLNVTSINGILNLTVFADGEIYSDYNKTAFGTTAANVTVTRNVTIDTTLLPEGSLNFTLLFEDNNATEIIGNSTVGVDKESYTLVFEVDNHGAPTLDFIAPIEDETMTGLSDLFLNITSDYTEVYMNVSVDDELTSEFNVTLVPIGAANHTINCSRYDNGLHDITVTIWTEEGLEDSLTRQVIFLDHVRFSIIDLTAYSRIEGNQTFRIRVFTPYDNVTLSAYVDHELSDVVNITLTEGLSEFTFNTAPYEEGEHNFTFKAYDAYGHMQKYTMILIVDNYGVPAVAFVAPADDIVVGTVEFTIEIDSKWNEVIITVSIDGVAIEHLTNVTVSTGIVTFSFDTGAYSKWQHEITVLVTTSEGETAEVTQTFGFANILVEEIIILGILSALAVAIPLYRKKSGHALKPVMIVNLLFVVIVAGMFLALGVSSYPLMVWHFNLASISALGSILVFTNWVIPLLEWGVEED